MRDRSICQHCPYFTPKNREYHWGDVFLGTEVFAMDCCEVDGLMDYSKQYQKQPPPPRCYLFLEQMVLGQK